LSFLPTESKQKTFSFLSVLWTRACRDHGRWGVKIDGICEERTSIAQRDIDICAWQRQVGPLDRVRPRSTEQSDYIRVWTRARQSQ